MTSDLAAFLRQMFPPQEPPKPLVSRDHAAWRPSYPGEEPPW
jgi:hypothetical protein